MPKKKEDERSGLISLITKPIQLAALVVLVVEGLLAFLLNKSRPEDISLYVILMVGVLVLTIVSFFILEYNGMKLKGAHVIPATGTPETVQKTYKWDVFLAAPMAALGDKDFETTTVKVKEIKKLLEDECNFQRIFYAGNKMTTKKHFQTSGVSIETDVNALRESQHFIMIYPNKIVSSVLFEAGIALAYGKPSFYFGHIDNFPFLMKQANQKFNHVKIHEAGTLDEIIDLIKINKTELFKIESAKV